ncbi:MAG: hypothetical protein QUU85_13580 [Candidatus Eisenbacteria bacterium]|nr:hypothetical protein [Candidatus Eisenbacteria bacterium]
MDDHPHLRSAAGRRSIRSQALLLCALPVFLLGVSLILLVEFGLREGGATGAVTPWLRYGSILLVLLFTMASLACGSYLAERTVRPIRALLHVAEGFHLAVDPPSPILEPDPDLRRLSLRIHTLVQQNRSGARAMMELEALRDEAKGVLARLREAGDRVPAPGTAPTPISGVASDLGRDLREEIDRYWQHLRDDLTGMAARAERIAQFLDAAATEAEERPAQKGQAAEGQAEVQSAEVQAEKAPAEKASGRGNGTRPAAEEFADLERLATVWSLEIERARRAVPDLPGSLGDCFHAFQRSFDALRGRFADKPLPRGEARVVRAETEALRAQIDRWLGSDPAARTILIDASLPASKQEGREGGT